MQGHREGWENEMHNQWSPATVKLLKQIGSMLVDIHGQHEHQSLLHPETHLSYLDKYGGERISSLLEEYRKLYDELMGVEALKKRIMSSEREREQRIDLLRYQMREIDTAALRPGRRGRIALGASKVDSRRKLAESIGRIRDGSVVMRKWLGCPQCLPMFCLSSSGLRDGMKA